MSKPQSSLMVEELKHQDLETDLDLYFSTSDRVCDVEGDAQPRVVCVCGTITVSF